MEIKLGLFNCIERMVRDPDETEKKDVQIKIFKGAKGLFGIESAKCSRDKKGQQSGGTLMEMDVLNCKGLPFVC